MGCCQTKSDGINIFVPNEQEINIRPFSSTMDANFQLVETSYNILSYLSLMDYVNLLNDFSSTRSELPSKSDIKSDNKSDYITELSNDEDFMHDQMKKNDFLIFLQQNVLAHKDVKDYINNDELTKEIFLEVFTEIFTNLEKEMSNHYKTTFKKNYRLKISNILAMGFIYCQSSNIAKIKLLFDLFQENEFFIEGNLAFENFLLSCFLICSNALLAGRKKVINKSPKIKPLSRKPARVCQEYCSLENCAKLLKNFRQEFFAEKKQMNYDEFLEKFKDFEDGFGWILFPSGIRDKLENLY